MLQRIQSVYLFVVAVLVVVGGFTPVFLFSNEGASHAMCYCNQLTDPFLLSEMKILPVAIFAVVAATLALVSLFAFKKRKRQLKLNKINMLVHVLWIGIALYYFFKIQSVYELSAQPTFVAIFPVLSLILLFLANKAIQKDEDLIRSVDRIR